MQHLCFRQSGKDSEETLRENYRECAVKVIFYFEIDSLPAQFLRFSSSSSHTYSEKQAHRLDLRVPATICDSMTVGGRSGKAERQSSGQLHMLLL